MIGFIDLSEAIALGIIAIEAIAMLIVTVIDREYDV